MVFVVQAHVVSQHVEWSIVGKGLWHGRKRREGLCVGGLFLEDVVLGDEMACTGVEGPGEEGAHDQIPQCVCACVLYE